MSWLWLPLSFPISRALLSPGTRVETTRSELGEKLAEQQLKSQLPSSSFICAGSLSLPM